MDGGTARHAQRDEWKHVYALNGYHWKGLYAYIEVAEGPLEFVSLTGKAWSLLIW